MTAQEALKEVRRMHIEDGTFREEADIMTILDYLAIAGVPGASKCYFYLIKESIEAEEKLKAGIDVNGPYEISAP